MADIPIKISELDRSYSLSASPVSFLINQRNDTGVYETCSLPLSVIVNLAKEEAKKELKGFIEVGTVIPYAGKVVGQESIKGWLLCNGQQVRKKDYESLWKLIGETYGPSNDDLFSLPDLRGRVEMGYSHTEASYEPDFGNWVPGEKIYLGEGNNANYPDKGSFNVQLKSENVKDHRHVIPPHKHKILDYSNMAVYKYKKKNGWPNKQPESYFHDGWTVNVVSLNWVEIKVMGPSPGAYADILFHRPKHKYDYFSHFPGGLANPDLDKMIAHRNDEYKRYKGTDLRQCNNFMDAYPIRMILTYTPAFNDEIKRMDQSMSSVSIFNNSTKNSSSTNAFGGDQFHTNIQPNIAMNFLIKY
jgi:microcystin-dependent protein